MARIDGPDGARKAALHQVAQQHRAQAGRSIGGADQGDAARGEKQMQISDGHGLWQLAEPALRPVMGTCLNRGGPRLRRQHRLRRVVCTLCPINRASGLHHLGVKAVNAVHPGPAAEQVNGGNRGKKPMHKGHKTVSLA